MSYHIALQYLQKMLNKMQLPFVLQPAEENSLPPMAMGLQAFGVYEEQGSQLLQNVCHWAKHNIIYKLTDALLCNYVFFLLPDRAKSEAMIIGPYISFAITPQQIAEKADQLGIPHSLLADLGKYYSGIPLISNDNALFVMINSFGEMIWGENDAFSIQDIGREYVKSKLSFAETEEIALKNSVLNMKVMEQRYAYENHLLDLVSRGWGHRAELMMRNLSQIILEERAPDPVRNVKNYAVIFNTLLRKAAEQGGVHPIYIDRLSSELARTIEKTAALENFSELLLQMVHRYSELVKNVPQGVSPLVQKVIANIDMDLAGHQSLKAHAERLNVSAGYLSTLFHKEMGTTLTDYVNARRMEYAAHLLQTTRQSVSSIAQSCGIQDDNYFTKLFKKYVGKSPRQYREDNRPAAGLGGRALP